MNRKEYQKKWQSENRDKIKEWKHKNKWKISIYNKAYRIKHPDIIKAVKERNKERNKEKVKEYRKNNPEKVLKWKEKRFTNLPKPLQCEICFSNIKICYDHDHKTGKFRGWICNRCNLILGFAKDNNELLLKIVEYLNKSRAN